MLKQLLKVEGLMPSEIETAIAEALKQEDLIVDAFVTVTVAEYHSRPINIMGAVKKPMTFQARRHPDAARSSFARRRIDTGGWDRKIFVTRYKSGPDGVLVHGWRGLHQEP